MLILGAGKPKPGKSPLERAFEEYGDAIEIVASTAGVLAKGVKAAGGAEGKVKKHLVEACHHLHEAHQAAASDMSSAHRKYNVAAGQGDLFKEGDGRGAEDRPGNGPARTRRSSGKKSASAPPAAH